MKRLPILLLALMVIGGCAAKQPQPLMTHGDPAVEALNESVLRIARAAEQASLAKTVTPGSGRVTHEYGINLEGLPSELRDPLLLEGGFHGELETFLKSLTSAIGWPDPVVFGTAPGVPMMVSLTEQRRPAVYWFADAGYQAGDGADVIVNTGLRQVVLTYKSPGGHH